MLQSGFVQLYEAAAGYGEKRDGSDDGERSWDERQAGQEWETDILKDLPAVALADLGLWKPRKQVPSANHIPNIETNLRKLMENHHHIKDSNNNLHGNIPHKHRPHTLNQNEHILYTSHQKDEILQQKHIFNTKNANVISIPSSELRRTLSRSSRCEEIGNLTGQEFIASGWTKAVYRGSYHGENVAIKRIDLAGHDMNNCIEKYQSSQQYCYAKSSQKILKEILLLGSMDHPHIIKVKTHLITSFTLQKFYV